MFVPSSKKSSVKWIVSQRSHAVLQAVRDHIVLHFTINNIVSVLNSNKILKTQSVGDSGFCNLILV